MTPLRLFARETRAPPAAVTRVAERALGVGIAPRAILRALPQPTAGAEQRVLARLRVQRRGSHVSALTVAAAAVFLVGLGAAGATALASWVSELYGPDGDVSRALVSEDWSRLEPTKHVRLAWQGQGTVAGSRRAPRVDWEAGTLVVEVEPERGVDLVVTTLEAEIRVIGTGFSVTRDALGTLVEVSHGRVALVCADGGVTALAAGASRTCEPTRPGGLLGRAQRLAADGAATADVLATAERGLAAGAEGPIAAELTLVRLDALAELGRHAEALSVAEGWLASDTPGREIDVRHRAARVALIHGGCDAAVPHLDALLGSGATAPELVAFADCVGRERPDDARAALVSALKLGVPAEHEPAIVARIARLPQ